MMHKPTDRDCSMPSEIDINLWQTAAEQTPKVWRWVFGVLTLGVFTLVSMAWKRERENVRRIERQVHERIDRLEHNLTGRVDEMNKHLIEIAQNTRN